MFTLVDAASIYVDGPKKVIELKGQKNRSPWIDSANKYVGIPLASPYCIASLLKVQSEAFQKTYPKLADPEKELRKLIKEGRALPITGGSQYLKSWAQQHKRLTTDPQKLLSFTGAIGGWTNPGGKSGHGFLVTERLTDNGKVTAVRTIEFNTSPSTGDRDGEGCFSLRRSVPKDRGHDLWWIDLTGLFGGDWWKVKG